MSFTTFGSGHKQSFSGKYVELVPGERLRSTDKLANLVEPEIPAEM